MPEFPGHPLGSVLEPVQAPADELEHAGVTEYLKLLAYLRSDVPICRVQRLKVIFARINIFQVELRATDFLDDAQDIK